MKKEKHNLLNYSFAEIDIRNYLNNFQSIRKIKISELLNVNIEEQIKSCDNQEIIYNKIIELFRSDVPLQFTLTNGFETFPFLKYYLLTDSESVAEFDVYEKIVDVLQKKFEVFHRIFQSYNQDFRKNSENCNNVNIYSLISIILQRRFSKYRNFNDFNTALKLNDFILFSDLEKTKEHKPLIHYALLLEGIITSQICES